MQATIYTVKDISQKGPLTRAALYCKGKEKYKENSINSIGLIH